MSDHRTPSSDPKARFSDEAVGALREALRRRMAEEPHDGDLKAALQRVSGDTRAKGLHSEHVVLLVKQLWSDLPGAALLDPSDRRRMLEQLVTRCLEEYYAGE